MLVAALALGPRLAHAQGTPNPPASQLPRLLDQHQRRLPLATNAPKNYVVTFTIYDAPTGNIKSSENQTVTVDRGYFSVLLGQGTASGAGAALWTNNLTSVFSGPTASSRYVGITCRGRGKCLRNSTALADVGLAVRVSGRQRQLYLR